MRSIHPVILAWLCLTALSCGVARHSASSADATLADSLWTFSQANPDGFTINIYTWEEPKEGIVVAYEATQNHHDRADLEKVVIHARTHEGYVGGWLNSEDGLYYFDSVRLFPEDSLSAAVNFGKANHQDAVYKLSTGQEIRLTEDEAFVSPAKPGFSRQKPTALLLLTRMTPPTMDAAAKTFCQVR